MNVSRARLFFIALCIGGLFSVTGVSRAASGKFDYKNIDCSKLDEITDKRNHRIAERKCRMMKPDKYKISNPGKADSEPAPIDVYAGEDKEKFRSMILSAWKKRYPSDKVLGVRFPVDHWIRNSNYKANATSIYKTDTSVLPARVVVQTDNRYATIFPAYINKNNLNGHITVGVDTKKSQYVIRQMALKNWNP